MDNEKALQYWRYKFDSAKNYYDEHWDAEERHSHIDYINAMNCAITALTETAELKRLLRLAVEDIDTILGEEGRCKVCGNTYCNGETVCKWRYADEVIKLLEDKE